MHLKGLTQRSGCFNNPQWVPQPIPQSTMKVSHNEEAATMGAQYRDTNEHFLPFLASQDALEVMLVSE